MKCSQSSAASPSSSIVDSENSRRIEYAVPEFKPVATKSWAFPESTPLDYATGVLVSAS